VGSFYGPANDSLIPKPSIPPSKRRWTGKISGATNRFGFTQFAGWLADDTAMLAGYPTTVASGVKRLRDQQNGCSNLKSACRLRQSHARRHLELPALNNRPRCQY
jgi:hypothetical protein